MENQATYVSRHTYFTRRNATVSPQPLAIARRGFRMDETDCMHARLVLGGRVVAEFTRRGFEALTFVLDALRHDAGPVSGLACLSVRNMTKGWTLQRPMLLSGAMGRTLTPVQPMAWQVH